MVHICSLVVQLTFLIEPYTTQFVLAIVFLLAVLTQLSFYHWFGNQIIEKSNKIGESLYMSKWDQCDAENRKIITIILERSKQPLALTVYKFTNVSLVSLIIRWAYSLFAVLQTSLKDIRLKNVDMDTI
ncbi:7tm Odorant receptor [Popillia japonica]|uniref:7tm Odorant receptor n=1 Tax=Popillia japonica TaxID=7064 RepID=A0AAW1LWW7_POPJA